MEDGTVEVKNDTNEPQAAEGRSLIAKNFKHSQEYLYNSDVSVPMSVPALTWDEWRMVWVTLQYRLCKTQKDDPKYADLERLCKKIAPVLAEGFGS